MRRAPDPSAPIHQVMPIVMTALAAFFGVCLYTGAEMGVLGGGVAAACFGCFGLGAYFIPVMLLLSAILWQRNVKQGILGRSMAFYVLVIFLVSVLTYTFGMPEEHAGSVSEFFALGQARVGGGILGGLAGFGLNYLVSKVGTIIFTIALLCIFLVLGMGLRPLALCKTAADALRRRAVRAREKRRLEREARVAQEMERRNEKIHNESNFYEETGLTAPRPSPKPHIAGDGASVFYPAARTPARPSGGRRFFDAKEDTPATPDPASAARPQAPVTEEKHPSAVRTLFDAEKEDQSVAPTSWGATAETPVAPEDSLEIQIVSSKPIPSNSDDPFGTSKTTVERVFPLPSEKVAPQEDPAAEVPATQEPAPAEPKEDAEGAVINKAHVVEHIGAETLGETKKYTSDTFFYSFPPLSLLREDDTCNKEDSDQEIHAKEMKLKETFEAFGVGARISAITRGPRITRYEVVTDAGVRINKVESLVDEITMNLEAVSIRIEAPIPGKAAIGIEVPNVNTTTVRLRGLLDTDAFRNASGKTTVCLGVDVVGVPVYADIEKMPHLLVAGATGMGKSVCINSILVSLLYKATPDEVKLILIDPKKVEFKAYANIPHLLVPVVTEAQKAAGALAWAVNEMERRYDVIESAGVRNIAAYNKTVPDHPGRTKLPQIVIVIDELHDLMLQAQKAVEDSIARIAAKARAAGIYLIIGTQRPSVNVITGVIKANIPSRIAFHVASRIDSNTILDCIGAEKLLNNGDMLVLSPGMKWMTTKRIQGAFLDDDEVLRVTDYLRKNSSEVQYDESILYDMERESERYNKEKKGSGSSDEGDSFDPDEDEFFYRAVELAIEQGDIATSSLQRAFKIGYGRAARIIDGMESMGIVGPKDGTKPRNVIITKEEYYEMRLRHDE
ncbi:MAG: DNA translocase FtsK [Clostridia bacterium]|nr:DNA translocase FtsK [Clostridia bacterium]